MTADLRNLSDWQLHGKAHEIVKLAIKVGLVRSERRWELQQECYESLLRKRELQKTWLNFWPA